MRKYKLPDYWFSPLYVEANAGDANVSSISGGVGWPSANRAFYMPVYFPVKASLREIYGFATNATGNYDIGFYDAAFNRIASKGTTAMATNTKMLLSLDDYVVKPDRLYYMAMVLSSTSGTALRLGYPSARALQAIGCLEEASALPLPNPATPATLATFGGFCPVIGFGVK